MRGLCSYVRVVILVAGVAACAASDAEESRRSRCTRYRDHLVALRLGDLPAGEKDPRVTEAHRAAMTGALGERFVAACEETTGNADLDCALAARDVSAATRCVEH